VYRRHRGAVGTVRRLRSVLTGTTALEIGGPSAIFTGDGDFPLYDVLKQLDIIDFSSETLWRPQQRGIAGGKVIIDEGTTLDTVGDGVYDVVLSSHMLEHTANPIKALKTWHRVCHADGRLVLVLPHRDATFDHLRPLTPVAHMVEDYERDMSEDDTTHFAEVLSCHDHERDPGMISAQDVQKRVESNLELRSLHQHVFAFPNALDLVRESGWFVNSVMTVPAFHIFIVASKSDPERWRSFGKSRRLSIFPTDRMHASR
jgi:SAM-dependent methyltransferase